MDFIKKIILILIFSFLALLFVVLSCSSDEGTNSDNEKTGISGTVTNAIGAPLSDVGVHLIFLDSPSPAPVNLSKITGTNSIVLASFRANSGINSIILNWTTSSESENLGFKILKSSDDNITYNLISSYLDNPDLAGQMNSITAIDYSYTDTNVADDKYYFYKLVSVDTSGEEAEYGPVSGQTLQGPIPTEYALSQNFPNPFNPSTVIPFQLPENRHIVFKILSWPSKTTLTTLIDDVLPVGAHQLQFDGSDSEGSYFTNGLYYYRMESKSFTDEKLMCIQMVDPEHIRSLNAMPLTKSGSDGKFYLDYTNIPIGESIIHTDAQGNEIGEIPVSINMTIILIKDGYKTFTQKLIVDGKGPINKSFTLSPL
jgi:hypothetical protein